MAETIFRYINGVLRPIKVNKVTESPQSVVTVHSPYQVPKHQLSAKHYQAPKAFTIPNVTCQRCGAKVFYYEHPNGARVLFDQLGPPWPKHPCYEASQAKQEKAASAKPRWENAGWLPLFYERQVLLQSGRAIRLQAHTKSYQVTFDIPQTILRQRNISHGQINCLLMQARMINGTVYIEIHDGVRPIKVVSKSFIARESLLSGDDAIPKDIVMEKLTVAQLSALKKLDVAVGCQPDKNDWLISISRNEISHTFRSKKSRFQALQPYASNLEAWVGKPNKKRNQCVYVLNRESLYYISSVISADLFSPADETIVEQVVPTIKSIEQQSHKVKLLSNVTIPSYSPTSRLVSGELDGDKVTVRVENRLLRLGESTKKIKTGQVKVYLRKITNGDESKLDYAIYINHAAEPISDRPRGYVSQISSKKLASRVSEVKKKHPDSAGGAAFIRKAIAVTLHCVDLSREDQIRLELTDQQREYRLRLHSTAQTVKDQLFEVLQNTQGHTTHLLKRAEHSYQFHIDGKFVVMASDESFFDANTSRNFTKSLAQPNQSGAFLTDYIQKKEHLRHGGLGAVLLEAAKKIKK